MLNWLISMIYGAYRIQYYLFTFYIVVILGLHCFIDVKLININDIFDLYETILLVCGLYCSNNGTILSYKYEVDW